MVGRRLGMLAILASSAFVARVAGGMTTSLGLPPDARSSEESIPVNRKSLAAERSSTMKIARPCHGRRARGERRQRGKLSKEAGELYDKKLMSAENRRVNFLEMGEARPMRRGGRAVRQRTLATGDLYPQAYEGCCRSQSARFKRQVSN